MAHPPLFFLLRLRGRLATAYQPMWSQIRMLLIRNGFKQTVRLEPWNSCERRNTPQSKRETSDMLLKVKREGREMHGLIGDSDSEVVRMGGRRTGALNLVTYLTHANGLSRQGQTLC
jgi:hypothetical protein